MATINLGRIKPVNKGTWSNSTAYAIDDFVQYTDNGVLSTYIAVATSTNQAPSTSGTENSTYWKFMAKGVASELSGISNNKIIYKDNSGAIQGLTYGATGTALKVTGSNTLGFGTAGGVLQSKMIATNNQASFASNTPTNWTALNMTFTPEASDSILELKCFLQVSAISTSVGGYFYDNTNSVKIGVGVSDGSRQRLGFRCASQHSSAWMVPMVGHAYYALGNTNATDFRIYLGSHGGTTTYLNRNVNNPNTTNIDDGVTQSTFQITEYANGLFTGSSQQNA